MDVLDPTDFLKYGIGLVHHYGKSSNAYLEVKDLHYHEISVGYYSVTFVISHKGNILPNLPPITLYAGYDGASVRRTIAKLPQNTLHPIVAELFNKVGQALQDSNPTISKISILGANGGEYYFAELIIGRKDNMTLVLSVPLASTALSFEFQSERVNRIVSALNTKLFNLTGNGLAISHIVGLSSWLMLHVYSVDLANFSDLWFEHCGVQIHFFFSPANELLLSIVDGGINLPLIASEVTEYWEINF